MSKYSYMVDTRHDIPIVVRSSVESGFERYDPSSPEHWHGSKFLDAFAWGGGDFVWYDDIPEKEAMKYIAKIDKAYAANTGR